MATGRFHTISLKLPVDYWISSGSFSQHSFLSHFRSLRPSMGSTSSSPFDLPTTATSTACNMHGMLTLPASSGPAARRAPPILPQFSQHTTVQSSSVLPPSSDGLVVAQQPAEQSEAPQPAANPFSLFRVLEGAQQRQEQFVDVEVAALQSDSANPRASRARRYRPAYARTPNLVIEPAREGAALRARHRSLSPSYGYLRATVFVPEPRSDAGPTVAGGAVEEPVAPVAHADDAMTCVVCLERPRAAALVHGSTAHLCCCMHCAQALQVHSGLCPMCRAPIQAVVQTFL